jgi:hypothetical protein
MSGSGKKTSYPAGAKVGRGHEASPTLAGGLNATFFGMTKTISLEFFTTKGAKGTK